jgi:hypothetical protein
MATVIDTNLHGIAAVRAVLGKHSMLRNIASDLAAADTADTVGGYNTRVRAIHNLQVDWQFFAAYAPVKDAGAKTPEQVAKLDAIALADLETAKLVEELHDGARPASGPKARRASGVTLGLAASAAGSKAIAAAINKAAKGIESYALKPIAAPAECIRQLQERLEVARSKVIGNQTSDELDAAETAMRAAGGDVDALKKMADRHNALTTAGTLFKEELFLSVVAPVVESLAEKDRNKAWRAICRAAKLKHGEVLKAHRANEKLRTRPLAVSAVKSAVLAAAEERAEAFRKEKVAVEKDARTIKAEAIAKLRKAVEGLKPAKAAKDSVIEGLFEYMDANGLGESHAVLPKDKAKDKAAATPKDKPKDKAPTTRKPKDKAPVKTGDDMASVLSEPSIEGSIPS